MVFFEKIVNQNRKSKIGRKNRWTNFGIYFVLLKLKN